MAALVKRPDLLTLHKEEAPNKDAERPPTLCWNVEDQWKPFLF